MNEIEDTLVDDVASQMEAIINDAAEANRVDEGELHDRALIELAARRELIG